MKSLIEGKDINYIHKPDNEQVHIHLKDGTIIEIGYECIQEKPPVKQDS